MKLIKIKKIFVAKDIEFLEHKKPKKEIEILTF